MNKYKIKLNDKTRIYSIDDGFEFLGFKYIRKNKKLIVKVKNQTKRRFKTSQIKLFRTFKIW